MAPVTIRTRKVRLDNHQGERTLILVSSTTGRQQQMKTNHIPAILNHNRNVIIPPVPQNQAKTVIITRTKTSTDRPIVLSGINKVNTTPKATVIYAGSRSISSKAAVLTPNNNGGQVTRILTSVGTNIKTFKTLSPSHSKTFVNIGSSSNSRSACTAAAAAESCIQQPPLRYGSPAPWSTAPAAAGGQQWSRPCTPMPESSFRLPRPRWPTVDPSYEAPKLQAASAEQSKCPMSPSESHWLPHVVKSTDDNGNIIKQEIKVEIKEEIEDSMPLDSIVLAPMKRPLSEVQIQGRKKKSKISIAQDNKLGPVKEHVNTVFEHYGITPSFSPNMEKLVEITGTTALNYLLYVDWCKKKVMKTVNQETYGRLFRNEFKKLVGTR